MKKLFMASLIAGSISAQAANVMAWVAPYDVSRSWTNINTDFGGVGVKDGLTHLALQFWLPTTSGGLIKDPKYPSHDITDASIKKFVDWGDANNVKTLLCVYNNDGTWNWSLAKAAFANNKTTFINALVTEMERLNLDGVEIDLEGPNITNVTDANNFISFMADLAVAVRAKGKVVTVATFASKWHIPGTHMWNSLSPHVDAITSMGYQETGINGNSNDGLRYAQQKSNITASSKLMLGMPGNYTSWLGNTAEEQLGWVVSDGVVGAAIWDIGLLNSTWKTAAVWNKLKAIKGTTGNSSLANSSAVGQSSSGGTTCNRALVTGYKYKLVTGDATLAGHQQNNYVGQSGPFAQGDKVVPQGANCNLAVTLDAQSDAWNLYATTAWTGSAQASVMLEKVTFVTASSQAQSSLAASSIAASSTELSSIASSSSQNTSSAVIINSDNYVEAGDWAATEDSKGSTSNPSDDADLIKDDTVYVKYVQVKKVGSAWPWTSLVMTPKDKKDMDLSSSTGITVTYKTSMQTFIRLNQHNPDVVDGMQHRYELPASPFTFNTVTLPLSSFEQAEWVKNDGLDKPLNASEIWAIDFVPNIDITGGSASITIKTLELGIAGTSSIAISSSEGVSSSDNVTPTFDTEENLFLSGRETVLKSGLFQLIGINGQSIKSGKASDLSRVLKIQESGVYFLRVSQGSVSKVSQLILN